PLLQTHGDAVARFLRDGFADVRLDWQLVGAVAHRHERTDERMTVDRSSDLHEPSRAEELHGIGHDHIGPAALGRALLQTCGEAFPQDAHAPSTISRPLPSWSRK